MDEPLKEKTLPDVGSAAVRIDDIDEPLFQDRNIRISMLRLDLIHPVVSGNKIFKLLYFLKEAEKLTASTIVTFGGPYSNHLAATSYACKVSGIRAIGYVRGERPQTLSATLRFCQEQGMILKFISRSAYRQPDAAFSREVHEEFGPHIMVPEGGFAPMGAKGASLICQYFTPEDFSHICLPIGSATTIAGLIQGYPQMEILGFPALKNMTDVDTRLSQLGIRGPGKFKVIPDYHFGGFAKHNDSLTSFMNHFHQTHQIALDFVYTAKMMFGVYDLAGKGVFAHGSRVLCLHTGGIQGNASLPRGALNF